MPGGLLIVGGSLAGLKAAQGARAAGFEGKLTVVGDEPTMPYDRPPLSKGLARGEITADECLLGVDGLDADWRLGEAAVALDLAAREVELASGERLGFHHLVLATGSRARPWPGPGAGLPGVLALRSVADGARLATALRGARRIAVIGAGFLGCEVAWSARSLGLEVCLIDVAERPMRPLGELLGERCAALHREHGVELRLGTGVEGILGAERARGVRLADGTVVEADLVLVALGSEPNTGWLRDSGLSLHDGGILCDPSLATVGSVGVWCAGDICAWPHPVSGRSAVRVEHWTNASEQGALAGRNAVVEPQERRPFESLPSFWSDQCGTRFQAVGFPAEATREQLVERSAEGERMVAIGSHEGRVVAAMAVGGARRMPWYRRQILARAGVDELLEELASDAKSFPLVGEMALR
ncbi:MAG: FAD-dependent oxidoreductase [Actinobacteria bacterium]|nr:FAD-dependent oxidoreductase [Actinomycetota bacterium]